MTRITGKAVSHGIAVGPVVVIKPKKSKIKRSKIKNVRLEISRLNNGLEKVKNQLQVLSDKAVAEVGESGAAIFQAHMLILQGGEYLDSIYDIIVAEKVNAEYAVFTVGEHLAESFAGVEDEYIRERAADIMDVTGRLVRALSGEEDIDFSKLEPSILVAEDLTPGEMVQMDKSKLLALVTVRGSANSHTAILARMMNIPAIVGADMNLKKVTSTGTGIVDGYEGVFVTGATGEELEKAEEKRRIQEEERFLLQGMKGQETVTTDGRKISLFANIGSPQDVAYALENDAEGIGLFRSEFLYLQHDRLPTEQEQFAAYRQVLEALPGKKVIIRTLDIGADKQVDYLELGKEDNPALGFRAIRICLTKPDIFKTQLRALMRAAVYGELEILYPMITSIQEVERIKVVVEEVCRELEQEKVPYKLPKQGIMIETPAAVMISDKLAEMVDFFSIGTNDLTQYALAIDRQNEKLDGFYDPHHPAVLRMIQTVIENGHEKGIPVGICGELGSDLELTETFIEMNVDELSVSPGNILKLRARIREI